MADSNERKAAVINAIQESTNFVCHRLLHELDTIEAASSEFVAINVLSQIHDHFRSIFKETDTTPYFKFRLQAQVKHVKSGKVYRVIGIPTRIRLEHNNEPAYMYTDGNEIWVRSMREFEDGRFVAYDPVKDKRQRELPLD